MVGYAYWTFDFKREKFYEEEFREFRVKYGLSKQDLVKDGTFEGKGFWYGKFVKDAIDDHQYFNFRDGILFMVKYMNGMVPEQGVVPQEEFEDQPGKISVKATFNIVNSLIPIIFVTIMLNMLIAIMNAA